jgi:hypothetical protein
MSVWFYEILNNNDYTIVIYKPLLFKFTSYWIFIYLSIGYMNLWSTNDKQKLYFLR